MEDRIPLYPKTPVSESAGSHGSSAGGTLDSHDTGERAQIIDVTAAKEIKGPTNPPHTWSADSQYEGLVS